MAPFAEEVGLTQHELSSLCDELCRALTAGQNVEPEPEPQHQPTVSAAAKGFRIADFCPPPNAELMRLELERREEWGSSDKPRRPSMRSTQRGPVQPGTVVKTWRQVADELGAPGSLLEELLEQSRHAHASVRVKAVHDMCPCQVQRNVPECWERLLQLAATDPDAKVRRAVVHTLCDGCPPDRFGDAIAILTKMSLEDPDPSLKKGTRQLVTYWERTGDYPNEESAGRSARQQGQVNAAIRAASQSRK
eukprot:COSAG03_NODE_999_length_5060_cov_5.775448_7_plen_249_part_00